MKTNLRFLLALALLVLTQTGTSASGAIIAFSNEAAFLAAIHSSPTVVNFEGADTSGGSPGYTSYGPGTNFGPSNVLTQTAGTLYAVTTGFGATNSDGDTNVVFDGNSGGTMVFNGTFSAFGMDVMSLDQTKPNVFEVAYTGGAGSPLNVTLGGVPTANDPPPAFFGVIGTAGEKFTSLIAPPGNTPYFDNVILGTAAPEPSTIVLSCLGAIGLFVAGYRRRNT